MLYRLDILPKSFANMNRVDGSLQDGRELHLLLSVSADHSFYTYRNG
jgi:hypothetical protein